MATNTEISSAFIGMIQTTETTRTTPITIMISTAVTAGDDVAAVTLTGLMPCISTLLI